ncbi:Wzz/FepE/Etk N-terminal domain-containing protein [Vibrio fluvialis]|uniref:LPS O-antigen chain length determinant protein WzzB n=1 Tax=Vibrio fluvialis TaxID=676 RepID=UPI001F232008|nr:Wzz/FepE/Etk N-terminal domain-containing protein [Vibrio fluvialis]MCE7661690.1 Wzz/FepE/Etk N-terminal domain-containing protein [Vibrio fluvialis]MCG6391406.1 Wzz/FepE/Etk N-terminal domain-containing protein [Vibrio fluvialis]MCG6418864.1 Wzz/FepE/Etk N-terminal domain-containing protein [Vibrio fluvialis]
MSEHHSLPSSPIQKSSDEIDLKELFFVLWSGKLTIVTSTFVVAMFAIIYALSAQQWWSSTAKIAEPQPQDMAAYRQQVKQFQPVFDIYQEDGTVLVSEELDDLVNPETLFRRSVDAYSSNNNKREFLNSSEEFQQYKSELGILDTDTDDGKDSIRRLYADWFQKITAQAEDKKAELSPYNLSFQSTTKESSYSLLNEYLDDISQKEREGALNNLQAIVASKRNELVQQKKILESQAKNRLEVEAERAKYALDIAKAADVTTPIQSNNSSEIFSIDMGAKALSEKVKVLESIKNLSVIEPRLQQIDAKLDMLNNLHIDRNVKFQTFRFLENVEQRIFRDKPKRALLVVLGTLLGGMLGIAIVLIRFSFRKES